MAGGRVGRRARLPLLVGLVLVVGTCALPVDGAGPGIGRGDCGGDAAVAVFRGVLPDGKLYTNEGEIPEYTGFAVRADGEVDQLTESRRVTSVAVAPDGGEVYVASRPREQSTSAPPYELVGTDLRTGRTRSLLTESWIEFVDVSPSGRRLLATVTRDGIPGRLIVLDLEDTSPNGPALLFPPSASQAAGAARWSPDGTRIASADIGAGELRIWEPATGLEQVIPALDAYVVDWVSDTHVLLWFSAPIGEEPTTRTVDVRTGVWAPAGPGGLAGAVRADDRGEVLLAGTTEGDRFTVVPWVVGRTDDEYRARGARSYVDGPTVLAADGLDVADCASPRA